MGNFCSAVPSQACELAWLQQLPAVQTFAQVWKQQYRSDQGHVRRLTPKDMPPVGEWVRSPSDPEVRYGKKRDFEWVGYKVHLTECCDEDLPHLITQVETVPAIEQDHHALRDHSSGRKLPKTCCRPNNSWMRAMSAPSGSCTVETPMPLSLFGPVYSDPSWQARTPEA